jgi:hypothetical protein
MLLCGVAFTGWYANHTLFDTGRTERVAQTVLSDARIRDFVASEIEPAIALASPTTAQALMSQSGTAPTTPTAATDSAQRQLSAALAEPAVQGELERFVGDLHGRVVGIGHGPVTLDRAAVERLVTAAVPTISPAELAKIPPVTFNVPDTRSYFPLRHAVADHWWIFAIFGVAMVAAGLVMSGDPRDAVKVVGKWLIGLSLAQLLFLWIVPVYAVPAFTDNVWAHVASKVARALNGGLVVGLVVIAAVGVLLLFVDVFLPRDRAAAPGPSGFA